jgi:hypothetical protein
MSKGMAKWGGLRIGSFVLAAVLLGWSGSLAKTESHLGGRRIFRPVTRQTVTPTTLNRATIGGPGAIRPGSGPSPLGGPAKAAAGINGTTIRSKH